MDSYPKSLGNNRWIIEVKGNGGNNEELYIELPFDALNQMGWSEGDIIEELYIEIPFDALNQMGWSEGDIIVWEEQDNGSFVLTKKVS